MRHLGSDERAVQESIASIRRGDGSASGLVESARRAIEVGRCYRAARRASGGPRRVAVAGWELGHNAAGRVQVLAGLHAAPADGANGAEVEILGFLFPGYGKGVWEPMRSLALPPVDAITVSDPAELPGRIVDLVLEHPCDLLHLSKPKMPNILLGLAARAIWDATVIVDVDDEELAFVEADGPADLDALLADGGAARLPPLVRLAAAEWTRFAVAMATEFDGVTVANEPLRRRYGGTILRHARDFPPPAALPALRKAERERLGIPAGRIVVLFLGTPRPHKGLVETATMIARAAGGEAGAAPVFLVMGDFPDAPLKSSLEQVPGVDLLLLGNQPIDRLPALVAAGDLHVSLLDEASPVSRFQTPAKLTDALAGGLAVIGRPSPGTADILEGIGGAFATLDEVAAELARLLRDPAARRERGRAGRAWYERHLTVEANAAALRELVATESFGTSRRFRPEIASGLEELLGRMLLAKPAAAPPAAG